MSETTGSLATLGTGVGLVVGAGLGATAASLFAQPLPALTGYGTGAGLVVGAAAGRLAEANLGREHQGIRLVGGAMVLGLIVGTPTGGLVAWVADATIVPAASVGAGVGIGHGLVVGVALHLAARDRAGDGDPCRGA